MKLIKRECSLPPEKLAAALGAYDCEEGSKTTTSAPFISAWTDLISFVVSQHPTTLDTLLHAYIIARATHSHPLNSGSKRS